MDYPFVVFCEDDMVLGNRYLEELTKLAMLCEGDSRIGMISMHSSRYRESIEEQHAHRYEYQTMQHSWGFGSCDGIIWKKLRGQLVSIFA